MEDISEEIQALYPDEELQRLVTEALNTDVVIPEKQYQHVTLDEYRQTDDWKARLRMLKNFTTPTKEDFDLLGYVLDEETKVPLRREAVVLLGMIEDRSVALYL